ncbi:hypothetical protein [Streptomyces sp. NPDC021562]|uniref:hypothetical protein n=1 Tax=Streptomyces sp. NPDC021562 TaxID=3155121 RepID=UPI0034108822
MTAFARNHASVHTIWGRLQPVQADKKPACSPTHLPLSLDPCAPSGVESRVGASDVTVREREREKGAASDWPTEDSRQEDPVEYLAPRGARALLHTQDRNFWRLSSDACARKGVFTYHSMHCLGKPWFAAEARAFSPM